MFLGILAIAVPFCLVPALLISIPINLLEEHWPIWLGLFLFVFVFGYQFGRHTRNENTFSSIDS